MCSFLCVSTVYVIIQCSYLLKVQLSRIGKLNITLYSYMIYMPIYIYAYIYSMYYY